MDESDLFAGIEASPAPARSPEDTATRAPSAPVAMVTHEHLAVPTLAHLREYPTLGATLGAVAEECLRAGARFPHTLLVGPADSSKRTIARAIAADMAAPFHQVDMMQVTDPNRMHAAFRGLPDGAVVLVDGVDTLSPNALSDLSRVATAGRSVREPSFLDLMRKMDREPWQRRDATRRTGNDRAAGPGADGARGGTPGRDGAPKARPRAYGDFTMVLTVRKHVPSDSALHRWVELQFFTRRTAATEAARLDRLFRHTGTVHDAETLATFASFAVEFGIRSLQFVNAFNAFVGTVDLGTPEASAVMAADTGGPTPDSIRRVLGLVFEHSMDPVRTRRAVRRARRPKGGDGTQAGPAPAATAP